MRKLHTCIHIYIYFSGRWLRSKPFQHDVGGLRLQLQGCQCVKPVMKAVSPLFKEQPVGLSCAEASSSPCLMAVAEKSSLD